jgi:tRNA-dihydrouridine synthase B
MKIHLAPLHGVTNKTFRAALFRHFAGFDSALAPFILACRVKQAKPNHFKDLLPRANAVGASNAPGAPILADANTFAAASEPPLVPQILGNDPIAFAETARVLLDLGYREINLNLGCPYPMVANKGRGSGLLPYPDRVAALLDAALALPGIELSVIMRLGRSEPSDIDRLMPALNDRPLSRVIIHPRVGTQMYRGECDLDGFARASGLCSHPVVYNGDIRDVAAFTAIRARFPNIQEWMIGRWAVSDPFIAEEIRASARDATSPGAKHGEIAPPTAKAASKIERLSAFHDDVYASYRDILCGYAHVLDKMKELWTYLGVGFPARKRELAALSRAKTPQEYERAVAAILGR